MVYTLTTPLNVGDLDHVVLVDKLQIVSISFNFDPHYVGQGKAVLSIVLCHLASGWKHTVTYQDAAALAHWTGLDAAKAVSSGIFAKLIADGKLPAGTLA